MTDDRHDSKGLEADIAQERDALARSLTRLSDEFSPERLVNSVGDKLKTQSEQFANTIVQGARNNPVALGLMGAGVAWLLVSRSTGDTHARTRTQADYDRRPTSPSPGLDPDAPSGEFMERVEKADTQLHDRGGSTDARGRLQAAGQRVKRSAKEMRDTLYDGTAQLGDAARERVIAAREKAIEAQARIEAAAGRAASAGRDFYADNPLVVGLGLAVMGAIAAYLLPRTETEDRAFGAQRDALLAEAERIFNEEVERAKAMGQAALDEVGTMAQEVVDDIPSGEDAVDMAEEKLREAGERVKTRAEEAAKT